MFTKYKVCVGHIQLMMENQFIERLYLSNKNVEQIPSPIQVCNWLNHVLKILFPELANRRYKNVREFQQEYRSSQLELYDILKIVEGALEAAEKTDGEEKGGKADGDTPEKKESYPLRSRRP